MSEQKVWVENMPESCADCPCISNDYEQGHYCNLEVFNYETCDYNEVRKSIHKNCPLHSIKDHDRELVNENHKKIIKFIEELALAWQDIQYDAFQSTMGEFTGSRSAIPRYAKKYFKLWKEMFNEDLESTRGI